MPNRPTDIKRPLDKAIERQQATVKLIQADAATLKVQNMLNTIAPTVSSKPTTPAS